ncbi:ABC transporter substrate-binding protein [Dolichospermum heterosporum]|uniref:ABC transporter substrate-binding protein n=1 Tax=Dolichospermum heterosporum TAC447 TaxID=747523 RepID=A0ABY5LYM3_9CYAN|nr:ABC transporter substrate-binding protein [Dolichospermum heterosporum]UUO15661.1 ABC transporter substrate-binding protein [Dolichospermum heterosporum TAC447]
MTSLPPNRFPPNPYIVGDTIRDPKKIVGREDIFGKINDNLEQTLILLYGQRRIGKSSVLNQISNKVAGDNFVFINCDFQHLGESSIEVILCLITDNVIKVLEDKLPKYDLINLIIKVLEDKLPKNENHELIDLIKYLTENIQTDINIFSKKFLPEIYKELGDKKLALLFDEFDVVSELETKINSTSNSISFLNYIMQLLDKNKKICVIPVVGRHISKLPKLRSFLKEAPNIEISLLDKSNNEKLITQPAEGVLQYNEEAIERIYGLTSGHPYLTQAVCFAIYNLASNRYKGKNQVSYPLDITIQDVEAIVDIAIGLAESGLDGFWSNLISEQKVILAAAAEAENIEIEPEEFIDTTLPISLLKLLADYGIVRAEYLNKAYQQLVEYEFLDVKRNSKEAKVKIKVKIELVRRWLVKRHHLKDLKDEISELQELDKNDVNHLLSAANSQREKSNYSQAIGIYQQALELNPNNFTTVVSLAEQYLKIGDVDKACELYKRAYLFYSMNNKQSNLLEHLLSLAKVYSDAKKFDQSLELYTIAYEIDPESSKDGLLRTRENYIHELIVNREWTKARQQCELILQIDPNSEIAQKRLREINIFNSNNNLPTENKKTEDINKNSIATPNWLKRGSILITSIGLAGIVVIGTGISQVFRTCPTGERKELGVFCVVDNSRISRGDRTLFPSINNIPRDQGIQSFKKADYQQAAQLFKKAVEANPNDPEVRIYYNNALTRQQGSPFTLAVVVPVGTNITDAQEILRGVAQAQDQFNQNKGLNGRLVEIVIANDINKEQAKQVAQELVKDASILGIIGHNSSDATQVALPEYAKAGLAVISPTSTSILLNNPVFFRAVYSDESGGKKLAEYTYKNLKLSKAVIFANPNSPYSNSIREVFTNEFEKLGGKVVPKPMIDLTATTFDAEKEVAKSVYGEKVQAALLFPDTQSINIAMKITKEITNRNERLRNSPQNSPIRQLKMLSGDTLYKNETLDRGGKDAEGLIIAIPWFRDTPQTKPFAEKSNQLWGGGISWRTATSYDATQAFIKALSNNPSRTTVLERLQKVNLDSSETSGYPLQFTEDRERKGESILVQIKDGKFVEIK